MVESLSSLTVIFATHNGENTLPTMLESYLKLKPPKSDWKIIAVDNASTDSTNKILQSFADKLPLQILYEGRRGKNIALNQAIEHISGDLVIFTDDDIVPCSDWLIQFENAAQLQPEYDIFGGSIIPRWPSTPPEWLFDTVPTRIIYAISADELVDGPVHPGRVWGASMAVRKRIFESGHRFDESIGPAAGNYRMGSETEFTSRLEVLGYKSWHIKGAQVEHLIRPHQMDNKWIAKRGFRFGRDMFWKENSPELKTSSATSSPTVPKFLGFPRWYFGEFVQSIFESLFWSICGNEAKSLKAQWNFQYWLGYFREALACRQKKLENKETENPKV